MLETTERRTGSLQLFLSCCWRALHQSLASLVFYIVYLSFSCRLLHHPDHLQKSMRRLGRPQAWARGHLPPPPPRLLEMLKSVFLLQMLSKVSVDEVFMHHFEKMSSAFGALPPDPHRGAASGPCWGTFVLQAPSLPTPGKNPAGTHVRRGSVPEVYCRFRFLTVATIVCADLRSLVRHGFVGSAIRPTASQHTSKACHHLGATENAGVENAGV